MISPSGNPIRFLYVEDSEDDYLLVTRHLRRAGLHFHAEHAPSIAALDAALDRDGWDVLLVDYTLGPVDARDVLARVRAVRPALPCIIVSGSVGEDVVAELMGAGAADYVMKDNLVRLPTAIRRVVSATADRLAREAAEQRVHHLAYVDAATGLPNTNALREHLAARVRPGMAGRVALVMVSVIGYRDLDFALGGRAVDELMGELGRRLDLARGGIFVARASAATFAVVVEPAPDEDAEDAVQVLVERLGPAVQLDDVAVPVELRLGVAEAPRDAAEPELLARNARVALAQARAAGEARRRYEAARDEYSRRRVLLSAQLRGACTSGEIFLVYQPRIRLRTGRVAGLEALARWDHPTFGMVPPLEFIGLAEHNGTITLLTERVLGLAIEQALRLRDEGRPVPIAVNIPVRCLESPVFSLAVLDLLGSRGLDPGLLELEVTESQLARDPSAVTSCLAALRTAGIHVYIDDFGTGFSSFGYLRDLPVFGLKIDRAFISPGFGDPRADRIVRNIIELAHAIDLEVVAEGVETAAALDGLLERGCDEAQGYHIARPLDSAALRTWWDRWDAAADG